MAEVLAREPNAVLAALDLDTNRRELYVEGTRDLRFLRWAAGDDMSTNAVLQLADAVKLPASVPGGARGRLMEVARILGENERQRYLADADHDRLLGRDIPRFCWLTDFRDMEGYVLHEPCVQKAFCVGLGRTRDEARSAFRQSVDAARRVALLRIASDEAAYDLPFQRISLRGKLRLRNGTINFDYDGYVTALLDASIGRSRKTDVEEKAKRIATRLRSTPDAELVHGKDLMEVLGVFMTKYGADRGSVAAILWSTFESGMVAEFENLSAVMDYLTAA